MKKIAHFDTFSFGENGRVRTRDNRGLTRHSKHLTNCGCVYTHTILKKQLYCMSFDRS